MGVDAPTLYADSNGVSIAYRVHGEGELDLVFVPGFVSHVELIWEDPEVARFLGRLASFARLVVFDKRGQGLSDAVRELDLEVRAGVHTGEVELRGADVTGMAVNIGARIGALAAPGEVLVSSTVRELVVGSGLDFAERGTHALKGAPGEWRLFAVDGADGQRLALPP